MPDIILHNKQGQAVTLTNVTSLTADNTTGGTETFFCPSGTLSIHENGTTDVREYASVEVEISSGGISVDNVAMRNITGSISGNASYITDGAFKYQSYITEANFPLCSSIGSDAFFGCNSLSYISFPTCASIGYGAFGGNAFVSVAFPMCTYIGPWAFGRCDSLASADFPNCITIDSYAFYSCSKLQSIDAPNCEGIYQGAFTDCVSLASVNFPACSAVSAYAFSGVAALRTASFPVCSNIYNYAFQKTGLRELTIGTDLSTVCYLIDSRAFSKCTWITSIYVPASLLASYQTATNWIYFSLKMVGV